MPFIQSLEINCPHDNYPFSVPAIRAIDKPLKLHPKVTFLVGENGMGKSTLLEGLADKWGFSEQSGNRSKSISTRNYYTQLAPEIMLTRGLDRPMDGFFLRAESLFNFATEMDDLEKQPFCGNGYFNYGGKSLHERSHGEAFLTLFNERFDGHGLFLLDEPEAALSATRQMAFLVRMHDLINDFSQFVIATHSPIILAYPDATIYQFDDNGVSEVSYKDTQAYDVTTRFLKNPEDMMRRLLEDED